MGFREESNNENVGVNWWSWYLFSLAIKRVYCREQYSKNLSACYYALTYYAILLWELGWWSFGSRKLNGYHRFSAVAALCYCWPECFLIVFNVSRRDDLIPRLDWWQFLDPGDTWHLPPDTDTLTHPSCHIAHAPELGQDTCELTICTQKGGLLMVYIMTTPLSPN